MKTLFFFFYKYGTYLAAGGINKGSELSVNSFRVGGLESLVFVMYYMLLTLLVACRKNLARRRAFGIPLAIFQNDVSAASGRVKSVRWQNRIDLYRADSKSVFFWETETPAISLPFFRVSSSPPFMQYS